MKAKKSLGQHFLKSENFLSLIVNSAKINPGDNVLEIGPGKGALTEKLLKTGARVIAVEKDKRLISYLEDKFKEEIKENNLKIIEEDILKFDINKIDLPYKLVANIPYYITGAIFRKFLETSRQPKLITLLVQKEIAQRIVAKDKKESILSISVKIFGAPKYIKTVPRGAFSPSPKVDSAILNIENISHKKLEGLDEKKFFKILHAGFSHKRKQLISNLNNLENKDSLIKIFEDVGIDLKIRAEDLSVETWVSICNKIDK